MFAEMLLKNKSLKELSLQDDSIGEEGTQKLIDSLTHNTTVKELDGFLRNTSYSFPVVELTAECASRLFVSQFSYCTSLYFI